MLSLLTSEQYNKSVAMSCQKGGGIIIPYLICATTSGGGIAVFVERGMNFTITTSPNGKYLICRVTGEITVDIARQFTKELDRLSRTLNIKRFLNDVRDASNALSTLQNYDFAYIDMAEMNLQRDACSAILVGPADKTHDFVETVTQNAGFNVRIFHDEEAAIAWLEQNEFKSGGGPT
jgi:hypothetical protein